MGAWACAGWRVWDLGNGTIMLQKLFNPEWQFTSKSFLLSSFLFSSTAEISRLELEFEESLPRKTASKRDWTGVKWSSQSRKPNFLTLPDLAFGFVLKRSGNEIIKIHCSFQQCKINEIKSSLKYPNIANKAAGMDSPLSTMFRRTALFRHIRHFPRFFFQSSIVCERSAHVTTNVTQLWFAAADVIYFFWQQLFCVLAMLIFISPT